MFDVGLRTPRHLGRPVISVGNLTTGGTGKTPMVIELARRILQDGHHPAVLLRGYRADSTGSDEARLIAQQLGPNVPVGTDADRVAGARRVLDRHPDTEIFLLDDGFQHRQVHRDLDLVLIDATAPFGFDRVLPRGLLREPVGALARADAVVITRSDHISHKELQQLNGEIEKITGRQSIAHTQHRWQGWCDVHEQHHPVDLLKQSRVEGVCGIANPDAFAQTLRQFTGEVSAVHVMPDHHIYSQAQLHALLNNARSNQADAVVTTDKDWVKWKPLLEPILADIPLPICRPRLHLHFRDGSHALDDAWRRLIERG